MRRRWRPSTAPETGNGWIRGPQQQGRHPAKRQRQGEVDDELGEGAVGLHRRLHLSEMASEGGEGGHGGRQSRTDSGTRSSEKTDGDASEAGKEHGRRAWVPTRWSMGRGLARRGRARARAPEEDGAAALEEGSGDGSRR